MSIGSFERIGHYRQSPFLASIRIHRSIVHTLLRQAVPGSGLRFVAQLSARPSRMAHSCSCWMNVRLTAIHSPQGPNDATQSSSRRHCSHFGLGSATCASAGEVEGFSMQAALEPASARIRTAIRIGRVLLINWLMVIPDNYGSSLSSGRRCLFSPCHQENNGREKCFNHRARQGADDGRCI